MNKTEQRDALAGWMGWTMEQTNVRDGKCWHSKGIQSEDAPPIYPDDLNAMKEVEDKIPEDNSPLGKVAYRNILMRVCGTHAASVHAAASQRSEAVCRMLWRERWGK